MDVQKKIDIIVESIVEYGKFEFYYLTNPCFKAKVNVLYKKYLTRKYQESDKKGIVDNYIGNMANSVEASDTRPVAPIAVHANYLIDAQSALKGCLQSNLAAVESEENINNTAQADTALRLPTISPFDRRLDRAVSTLNSSFSIIPISTTYAQSSTIGYTVSESYIQESKVKNKQKMMDKRKRDVKTMQNNDFYIGVPALMNNYAYVKLYGSKGGSYLINQKGERKFYEIDVTSNNALNLSQNPTTTSIIDWGNGDPYGRTPYMFSDFVFNKYWKKVPNNRLITLRRYAAPILDNLKFPGMDGTSDDGTPGDEFSKGLLSGGSASKVNFPPMASAITYFGEETDNKLSELLKFSTGFEWDEVEANIHEVQTSETPDSDKGPGGLWPGLTSFANKLNVIAGNWNADAAMNKGHLPPDPYKDGPYENRILGPVNRITKVKKRKPGIKFEMNGLELKFDYIARPIGGINTKSVLLDILGNFLILGSTSAVFWGGQHRFMSNPTIYPFLGGDKGIQQWYSGKPLEWGKTTVEQFLGTGAKASSSVFDMAKQFFSSILDGGGKGMDLMGAAKNLFSGDNKVASNLIKQYAAGKSAGQIPYLTGLKALLTGEPVGEWHVTIGNPLNPIAMIGNLVCDSVQVEFGNELGPDDFPLEMRVTVKLSHGMARDRDALQSMFNRGMGRYYDISDDFRGSAEGETKVDKVTGGIDINPDSGRNPIYYKTPIANSQTIGGTWDKGITKEDSMGGAPTVWNRTQFAATSPNSDQIMRTKDNPLFRSSYRTADWVALKSLI